MSLHLVCVECVGFKGLSHIKWNPLVVSIQREGEREREKNSEIAQHQIAGVKTIKLSNIEQILKTGACRGSQECLQHINTTLFKVSLIKNGFSSE